MEYLIDTYKDIKLFKAVVRALALQDWNKLRGEDLNTVLMKICEKGNVTAAKIVLGLRAKHGYNYERGLYIACSGANYEMIDFMMKIGAKNLEYGLCRANDDVKAYVINKFKD